MHQERARPQELEEARAQVAGVDLMGHPVQVIRSLPFAVQKYSTGCQNGQKSSADKAVGASVADAMLWVGGRNIPCACPAVEEKQYKEERTMKTIAKHLIPNAGVLILAGLLLLVQVAGASQEPAPAQPLAPSQTLISYQGTLTDENGSPVNETLSMIFEIYDGSGNSKWGPETQSVNVSNGLFHVLLGSVEPIPTTILGGDSYLDISVNGESLLPRERLTSVLHAMEANTLPAGASTQGDLTIAGNLDMNDQRILDVSGITYLGNIIRPGAGTPPSLRLIGEGDVHVFLDSNNDSANARFSIEADNGAFGSSQKTVFLVRESGNIAVYGSLNMQGHSILNCGALIEANLQTAAERTAARIDRFEEGDVLCWSGDRLNRCAVVNDRLVQAVADKDGKPIIIGAEVIKVMGPVRYGDLLVASGVPGYAMVDNDPRPGAVIAQALEDFDGELGIIKAMIRKF